MSENKRATASSKTVAKGKTDKEEVKAKAPVKAKAEPKVKAPAKVKAEPKAKAPAKAKAEPKAKTPAKAKAEPKAKALAKAKAEPKAKAPAKAKAEPKAKTPAKAKAEPKAKTPAKAKAEPKAKAPAKAKAEPKAKTPAKAKAKAEPKAKAPAKAKTEQKAKAPAAGKAKKSYKPVGIELAELVASAAAEHKPIDPLLLDLTGLSSIADWFFVASGENPRQMTAIAEKIIRRARDHGVKPLGQEGLGGEHWVLVDLGDVIVHIFNRESREMYDLEGLWTEAPRKKA